MFFCTLQRNSVVLSSRKRSSPILEWSAALKTYLKACIIKCNFSKAIRCIKCQDYQVVLRYWATLFKSLPFSPIPNNLFKVEDLKVTFWAIYFSQIILWMTIKHKNLTWKCLHENILEIQTNEERNFHDWLTSFTPISHLYFPRRESQKISSFRAISWVWIWNIGVDWVTNNGNLLLTRNFAIGM